MPSNASSVTKTLSHVYQGAGRAEYIGGAYIQASGGTRTVNVKLTDGYKWEYCSVYAWSGQDTGALERSSVVVYFKDGSTTTIFGYAPRNQSQNASFSRYFSEAQMANIDFVQCTAYLGGGVNSSSTAYAYCYGSKLPWAAE